MRFLRVHLLTLIIALTSIASSACDQPTIELSDDQITSLQVIPSWETDSLRFPEAKHSEKFNHIAQDFIPIVIIAEQWSAPINFHHYIPLYSLVREKEYFLLI